MTEPRQPDGPGWDPLRIFTRALLEDLQALEIMLEQDMLEAGVYRIGAEQEMFLVDRRMDPATTALEVLEKVDHPQVRTELGLFNLEINLSPVEFRGDCLAHIEHEAEILLAKVARAARIFGTRVLLTGILPTLRRRDLTLDAMTPYPRYRDLNRATVEHRGGDFRLRINGLDELNASHGNVMFEACNTSFQIHLQVDPESFTTLYNLAQAITAPVLGAGANSPVFLQHRLWHETRMALFHQSIDSRSDTHHVRQARPRVIFGDDWLRGSVLEILRDDVARFRVFLPVDPGPSSLDLLARGEVPPLRALCLHNGTVYRWNRPCYGMLDGVPHLRIEHRALPAGPTIVDELANAAFWVGLMTALPEEYGDITRLMSFDDAKSNFLAAARYGLHTRLRWVDGETQAADALVLDHLLPLARAGLRAREVRDSDADRYLGVFEERVRSGRTGAQWAFDSLAAMGARGRSEDRYRALAAEMYTHYLEGEPVHRWPLARLDDRGAWLASYRRVEQVMTRDLFTVRPDDLIDLAANLMDWEHIRHVPVEDEQGHLVGLVTHRQLLRLLGRRLQTGDGPVAVKEIMTRDPVTVHPDTTSMEAIAAMRERRVSCLPVVERDGKLVGIVSERDFIRLTATLLDEMLDEPGHDSLDKSG